MTTTARNGLIDIGRIGMPIAFVASLAGGLWWMSATITRLEVAVHDRVPLTPRIERLERANADIALMRAEIEDLRRRFEVDDISRRRQWDRIEALAEAVHRQGAVLEILARQLERMVSAATGEVSTAAGSGKS